MRAKLKSSPTKRRWGFEMRNKPSAARNARRVKREFESIVKAAYERAFAQAWETLVKKHPRGSAFAGVRWFNKAWVEQTGVRS